MVDIHQHIGMLREDRPARSEQHPTPTRRHPRHAGHHIGADGTSTRADIVMDLAHLDWQRRAACIGSDPEAFFPDGPVDARTLAICHTCPVFARCLRHALDDPELRGVWAATTDAERKRMRRKFDHLAS